MARRQAAFASSTPDHVAWSPQANPAVRELLDHIARQLAEEYVRLMKQVPEENAEPRRAGEEADR
jgi:hypothetical protein